MTTKLIRQTHHKIANGVMHKVPPDLEHAIISLPKARVAWEDITPLARNEWICWIISVKKAETRKNHIKRAAEDLIKGKRRPCCWAGCNHR
ncbi:MAG: YdeI/OmpD-associated family protein [bacterium]|nr:YdeI/OmpD-associated family protein [bacterium]